MNLFTRSWFDRVEALLALALARAAGATPKQLASAWAQSAAATPNPGAANAVTQTITPLSTGKLRVWLLGTVQNRSDSGTVQISQGIGHGAGTSVDYTGGIVEIEDNGGGREYATVGLVVDLDVAAALIFPVGTPVTIRAVLDTTPSPGQAIQWATGQMQMAIQERES
jgi:hypothetical protein